MSPATLVSKSLRQTMLDHAIAAVAASPLQVDPFPHILIRGLFPSDDYQRLLASFPPLDAYEPFGYEKHSDKDGKSNRWRFRLDNACLEALAPQQRELWWAVRGVLGSRELKESVFQQLRQGLAYRYSCDPAVAHSLPGFALPELFHETAGYCIKPHPDTRRKVVTMQIALPAGNDQEGMGTEFYRRSLRPDYWLREPRGFEIAKVMPFLPNTAYAFVVLNTIRLKSWHGRSVLANSCRPRNSILNIWYENPKDANQDILADNMAATHRTR